MAVILVEGKGGLEEKLTKREFQILLGSLLGDGSLVFGRNKFPQFRETHGDHQKEYLGWKYREFSRFNPMTSVALISPHVILKYKLGGNTE